MVERTNESSIAIFSSTRNDRDSVGIRDKEVRASQRFKYATSSLSNQYRAVKVSFLRVVDVHSI